MEIQKIYKVFLGDTEEAQRECGAGNAPMEMPNVLCWKYKGNTKETRRAMRTGDSFGCIS